MWRVCLVFLCVCGVVSNIFGYLAADLDGSGRVDIGDLAILSSQWLLEDEGSDYMGYDNSNVEVVCAGYGVASAPGNKNGGLVDYTLSNPNYKFVAGVWTGYKIEAYTDGSVAPTVKLKVLTGTGPAYTLVHTIDISYAIEKAAIAELGAGIEGYFSAEFDLTDLETSEGVFEDKSVAVLPTQFLAVYGDTLIISRKSTWDQTQLLVCSSLGDNENLVTLLDDGIYHECIVSTNETIVFDSSTGYGNGDRIPVPYYEEQNQYIMIEDVVVPNTEDLNIDLVYIDAADGTSNIAATIAIDFSANTISLGVASDSLAGQAGDKLNLHIWLDPVNDLIEVIYVNTEVGQGPSGGVGDLRFISLQGRIPAAITADIKIKQVVLTNVGTGASVGRIVSCRKPVVSVGDSFATGSNIGGRLGDADVFSEQRYAIITGLGGNSVTRSSTTLLTSVMRRWNSGTDDNDANIAQDIIGFRDVVFVLINGPGINDINNAIKVTSSSAAIRALATELGGAAARIAGDAVSPNIYYNGVDKVTNDVILCEMIPKNEAQYAGALPNVLLCETYVNDYLASISHRLQVPLARVYSDYANNGGYTDATHADATGQTWIAQQIADAYEKGRVATYAKISNDLYNSGMNDIYANNEAYGD